MECFHLVKHTTLGKEDYRMPRSGKGVTLVYCIFFVPDKDDKYLTSNPITPFGKYLDVKTNGFDTPLKLYNFT